MCLLQKQSSAFVTYSGRKSISPSFRFRTSYGTDIKNNNSNNAPFLLPTKTAVVSAAPDNGGDEEYDNEATTTMTKIARDTKYMKQALDCAKLGYGSTYPNPAVGCVIVQSSEEEGDVILGRGFHPKSGMPHAEIFALLEAAGHVEDGIQAASSVLVKTTNQDDDDEAEKELSKKVHSLLQTYIQPEGAKQLFSDIFKNDDTKTTTAYVTLEPCCHTNKQTPPCASTFLLASIDRVVVGYRDPNPYVDGGGVSVMRSNDVTVDVLNANVPIAQECSNLVRYFAKRITSPVVLNGGSSDGVENINGKKKRFLRSLAGRMKRDGSLVEIEWTGSGNNNLSSTTDADEAGDIDWEKVTSEIILNIPPSPQWVTHVDANLWDHELVLLRLGNIISKKKGVKVLGETLVNTYLKGSTIVQVVGHTVLLYRPKFPKPVITFEE